MSGKALLAPADRGKGLIYVRVPRLSECPPVTLLSLVGLAYPLFTFSKAWLSSSFRQRVFWMRDNNNQIFWCYSPGELIALWVSHLKREKYRFKKRYKQKWYEQKPRGGTWSDVDPIFDLYCSPFCQRRRGWGYIPSLKESRKAVPSGSLSFLHTLPLLTGWLHVACCSWRDSGRTRTQLP